MDDDRFLRIAVEPMDALPEVLSRVRGHAGRPVFLTIPEASPLFLTAAEFRALRETVRSVNANLVIVSEDRQRQDFARLFNLVPAEDEAAAIAWLGEQAAPPPFSKSAIDPALGPPRAAGSGGWAPRVEAPNAVNEPATEPATVAAPAEPATMALVPVESPTPMPLPAERRKRRKWPLLISILALLLLLGSAAAWLPQATVTLTRQRTPISARVPIIVTEPGESPVDSGDAVVIPGERRVANVTVTATVPATGEVAIPDQPARGGITFANTSSAPVTLPAGAEITSDGGLVFTLDAEVTIPAASAGRSGSAEGAVTAASGGAAGNLGQGALSGQHASGVYFSNRNGALTGGTDRVITVVSDTDMETARAQLETQLSEALETVLNVGDGSSAFVVVPGSIIHPGFAITSNVEVGNEAADVEVEATTNASGLVFDAEVARTAILDVTTPTTDATGGGSIDPESIEIIYSSDSATASNAVIADVVLWRVTDLDGPTIDRLAGELARTTVEEAVQTASAIDGVVAVSIDIRPDWLPDSIRERMPFVPQRIDVVEE